MLTIDVVNDGDLIIRDLAYMHLKALKEILIRLGPFLCRLQTQRKVYQQQGEQLIELDFAEIALNMREFNLQRIEESMFLGRGFRTTGTFVYLFTARCCVPGTDA